MSKLVIVSVIFRGRRNSRLVNAKMVEGKANVPKSFLDELAKELGCSEGNTYTIG